MPVVAADLEYKIRILKSTPLFKPAEDAEITELARVSRVIAVPRNAPLMNTSAEGSQIFAVQSGIGAELHLELGDGRPVLIKLHGPGSVAGVVSALLRESNGPDTQHKARPSRRIDALSNMSVLCAPSADFLRLCRRNSELSTALSQIVAEQCELLARIYARSTTNTLEMRLAAFISRLTELSANDDWNPVTNIGRLSQSSVATMLGVSREHVNRTLAMWERSGLIFQNKAGDFIVQNARRLSQLSLTPAERGAPEMEDEWLQEIDAHLDQGLNQTALHLALDAVKRSPRDLRYCHRAVLATARFGAISEALGLIEKWKLDRDRKNEELASLRPRLLRDLAFASDSNTPDFELLHESAEEFEKVFVASKGCNSGVNAAAGYALIGDGDRGKAIASMVLHEMSRSPTENGDDYWRRAVLAECKLLQGDAAAAASLFEAASSAADATPGKKATTRRQLRRLKKCAGIDDAWIDRVTPQTSVLFYSGPLAHRAIADSELPTRRLLNELDHLLTSKPIAWAYGALASGADIIIAEALINAGVELNVCLPLPPREFLAASVAVSGPEWRERFIACMRAASSIEWNRRASMACESAYRLGAVVAMGKSIRYASQLETEAIGFFALEGNQDAARSLSKANAEMWTNRNHKAVVIGDPWPVGDDGAALAERDDILRYALIVQCKTAGDALAGLAGSKGCVISIADAGLNLLLFETPGDALAAGMQYVSSAEGKTANTWLDAGVFSKKILSGSPAEAIGALITSACRPITEPGKIYASELFTSAALLSPPRGVSFEYIGYMQTREKLDPCALYLLRF